MKNPVRTIKRDRPVVARVPMVRAKLVYRIDGKGVVTNSKFYPSKVACIVDWLSRGFVVIEDHDLGGGWEVSHFPDIDTKTLEAKLKEKYDFKSKKKGETNE